MVPRIAAVQASLMAPLLQLIFANFGTGPHGGESVARYCSMKICLKLDYGLDHE